MYFLILLAVLLFLGFLICVNIVYELWLYTKTEYKLYQQFPGFQTYFFIGSLKEFLFLDPAQAFTWLRNNASTFKQTYSQWFRGILILHIIRAKDAEYILTSNKCINKSPAYSFLHPFMGTGLLTSGGLKWQQRRKILTPAFHFNILQQQFHQVFKDETRNFVEMIKRLDDKVLPVQQLISMFTLNTICETAMGVKLNERPEAKEYRKKLENVGELLLHRLMRPWLYSNLACHISGYFRNLNKYLIPIHNFSRQIIKERRQLFQRNNIEYNFDENIYETKKTRYAMLDTLLSAESNSEAIDDDGIREEVDTFMFEGHDTTSAGLTFIIFLLAENPDVQQKVYTEILAYMDEQSAEDLTLNQLNDLKYLDRVIKECLRMYPPVSYISRQVSESITFTNNITLPVGTETHFHIYDLHRDPNEFPNPEIFDPDRFLPENMINRHPFAYLPFSAGPRNCIGQKFALLEIKTLMVKIILNFRFEQVTRREDIILVADLVLRTKKPVLVKFIVREDCINE